MYKIEFAIAGSPTEAFYSQMAFFRLALDYASSPYCDARLITVFGDEQIRPIPDHWRPYFKDIDVDWVDPNQFQKDARYAQVTRRYDVFSSDADVTVMVDADTALMAPFPELLVKAVRNPAFRGSIAHIAPPIVRNGGGWDNLFRKVLGRLPDCSFRHSLVSTDDPAGTIAHCQFYINQGVFFGTPALFGEVRQKMNEIRPPYLELYKTPQFSSQVLIALAIADLDLPFEELAIRYNFPNDPIADRLYPDDLNNMVICHYLRHNVFDRWKIFASKDGFQDFLKLKLTGSNLRFQQHVRQITGGNYPFS